MRYVIIGNSAGGISAAKSIRMADPRGKITIFSDEPEFGYSRIAIPEIMKGKLPREKAVFSDEAFYENLGITLRSHERVEAIDAENNRIVLEDGRRVFYDRLLIASGASPVFPAIKGIGKQGVYGVRTLKDLEQIEKGLKKGKKAVILGGGLVGMKSAEALHELGCEITIIELLDRILPLRLDPVCSRLLTEEIREQGIRIILNSTISEIRGDRRVRSVCVNDEEIPADILIIGVGVRPNIDFTKDTGLEVRGGIVVDHYLRTSVEDIYAVGDAAVVREIISEAPQSIPIWPEASVQGRVAGLNMAGIRQEYAGGMVMNSIKVFGLPIVSFGHIEGSKDRGFYEMVRYIPEKRWYRRMVFEENRLRGAIFVGDVKSAGIAQWLIRKEVLIPEEERKLLLGKGFDYAKVMKYACVYHSGEVTHEN